jgi:hypothetical protein
LFLPGLLQAFLTPYFITTHLALQSVRMF